MPSTLHAAHRSLHSTLRVTASRLYTLHVRLRSSSDTRERAALLLANHAHMLQDAEVLERRIKARPWWDEIEDSEVGTEYSVRAPSLMWSEDDEDGWRKPWRDETGLKFCRWDAEGWARVGTWLEGVSDSMGEDVVKPDDIPDVAFTESWELDPGVPFPPAFDSQGYTRWLEGWGREEEEEEEWPVVEPDEEDVGKGVPKGDIWDDLLSLDRACWGGEDGAKAWGGCDRAGVPGMAASSPTGPSSSSPHPLSDDCVSGSDSLARRPCSTPEMPANTSSSSSHIFAPSTCPSSLTTSSNSAHLDRLIAGTQALIAQGEAQLRRLPFHDPDSGSHDSGSCGFQPCSPSPSGGMAEGGSEEWEEDAMFTVDTERGGRKGRSDYWA